MRYQDNGKITAIVPKVRQHLPTISIRPLHLRQLFHRHLRSLRQACYVHAGALEQSLWPIILAQHGQKYMGRLNILIVVTQSQRLGLAQGLLKLRAFLFAKQSP